MVFPDGRYGAVMSVDESRWLSLKEASEMRRAILDTVRRGDMERGEMLLEDMEDVYVAMTTLDFPDAVTGGLRRTTDALRAVLQRTRGDLTVSKQQEKLRKALVEFESRMDDVP